MICYFSCESCPKGKQLTLNPRQVHMKNNISYLLWLYVLQLGFIITITMICYFSCESCPKGKQLTLNPRQVHMKNNISYLLWLYVLQLGFYNNNNYDMLFFM